MIGERVSWGRRAGRALITLIFNLVLWVAIPSFLGSVLSQALPSTPLATPEFVYGFGAVITGLQTLAALTEGMALSVPFNSGGHVASAYYIWAATSGGDFQVTAGGVTVGLSFVPLLFLLMLPALFAAVRAPLTFLLEQSEVARPMADEV